MWAFHQPGVVIAKSPLFGRGVRRYNDGVLMTIITRAASQGCRFLQQLVQDMNAQLTTFTCLEHYEAELGGSITPIIADKFEALDDDSADLLQVSNDGRNIPEILPCPIFLHSSV